MSYRQTIDPEVEDDEVRKYTEQNIRDHHNKTVTVFNKIIYLAQIIYSTVFRLGRFFVWKNSEVHYQVIN